MKTGMLVQAGASLCLVCACMFSAAPCFAAETHKTVVTAKVPASTPEADAARAAGRAVDLSAEDFEDADS